MIESAYTENRSGLQFDPRTKIILLILCVISATIASSLLYESVLVFAITVFGCASGKVRRSLFCIAFYGAFYILTLWIRSLEKGVLYTVFTSWLGLFYTVYQHHSFHDESECVPDCDEQGTYTEESAYSARGHAPLYSHGSRGLGLHQRRHAAKRCTPLLIRIA